MPLSKKVLEDELSKFMDTESPMFVEFPDSAPKAAAAWANAFGIYAKDITPQSTAVTAATKTLELSILSSLPSGTFTAQLGPLVSVFALTIGLGMLQGGFTGTNAAPPPLYKPFFDASLATGSPAKTLITQIANTSHIYFNLGLALDVKTLKPTKWR